MGFNLENYETVEDRLIRFWADHPNGRVSTLMVHYDDNKVVFRAEVYFDAADTTPKATGYAEEVRGASPVNKTSHVENAETSAIGRGLANCNYAPRGARPSREEMAKVERQSKPEVKAPLNADQAVQVATEKLGATLLPDLPAKPATIAKVISVVGKKSLSKAEALEMATDLAKRPIANIKDLTQGEADEFFEILSAMK